MKNKPKKSAPTKSVEISEFTRWGFWEKEVLNRVNNPTKVQEVVEKRRKAMDDDQSFSDLVADYFKKKLRERGHPPESSWVFIPTLVINAWLYEATRKHYTSPQATTVLEELGITELTRARTNEQRGWQWYGAQTPDKKKRTMLRQGMI